MPSTLRPSLVNGRWGDPALFVDLAFGRHAVLFDLGDLHAMSPRDLMRVEHVFVSHMHVDHLIGFDTLLRANVGRDKRIGIVGPEGIIASIGHRLASYTWDLVDRFAADLVFDVAEMLGPESLRRARFRLTSGFAAEELGEEPTTSGLLLQTPLFSVAAAMLEHHGTCLGFALVEQARVNVRATALSARGLAAGAWLNRLKAAVRGQEGDDTLIALPDGRKERLADLRALVAVEPSAKLGYLTDIRDTPANRLSAVELCRGAETLFIDSAFLHADAALAYDRGHLTARAAGEIARAAGVMGVEPFHFSPRYKDGEEGLLAELALAFEGAAKAEPGSSPG